MAAVMIGIDPHKASHAAATIGLAEEPLGQVRIPVSVAQVEQLVAWAAGWPKRTWAVEGATGPPCRAPSRETARHTARSPRRSRPA